MAIIIVFVNRTPAWTVLLLLTLWVLLVLAALDLQVVRLAKAGTSRNLSRTAAVLLVTVVVVVFGVYNWPSSGLGELTSAERDNFKATLKTQNEPILIHLMCPPNDERDCTVASQFIVMFQEMGWQVKGNIVDRVYNGNPKAGLYFVLHSTIDPDPGNKEGKTGAWTEMPRAYYTVKSALDKLTKTNLVVGASYPEKELGLYFGIGTAKP
jgi:hypothetical protein